MYVRSLPRFPEIALRISTDDGSHGHHGLVTDLLSDLYNDGSKPTAVYTCPEQAAREWQLFFQEHPQLIGLSGDLPEPGSYVSLDDFGIPVLATRDAFGGPAQ